MVNIVLAQGQPGFDVGSNLLPSAEDLRLAIGAIITWGIFAFAFMFVKSSGPWVLVFKIITKITLYIALGAIFAAIPVVGTLLNAAMEEWGAGPTVIAIILIAVALAADMASGFPDKLKAKGLLFMIIGGFGGFALSAATDLDFFTNNLENLSTLALGFVKGILQALVDMVNWIETNKGTAGQ